MKEIIILKNSIKDDNYYIDGIEVEDGDYKDASMFTVIIQSGFYTSYSPRGWYDEIEAAVNDHKENNVLYKEFNLNK